MPETDTCTCGHVRVDHAALFGPGSECGVYGCMCPVFTPVSTGDVSVPVLPAHEVN